MTQATFGPINRQHINQSNFWLPIIRVAISDSDDPNVQRIIDDEVLAIVDTGSTCCCIDEKYAAKHNTLKVIGHSPTTGATGTVMSPIYSAQIIVDGHALQMQCAAIPLHSDDNPCDLLFGMDAIRFFDLSLHRYPQRVTLTWIEQ
jgi:hypothetical protein